MRQQRVMAAAGSSGSITTMMAVVVGDGLRVVGGRRRQTAMVAGKEADSRWGGSGTDLIFMLKHSVLEMWQEG